jgi:hypothetical protein
MPLGRWKTFSDCVGAQKRMGKSDDSARKICGKIQAETEGGSAYTSSSQKQQFASQNAMSFPPSQQQEQKKKPEEESAQISLSQQQGETVLSALVNAKEAIGSQAPELTQQLDEAIMVFKEVANVSE